MRAQLKLLVAVLVPVIAGCPAEAPEPQVPKSAVIRAFTASPGAVEVRGGHATLHWEVEHATSVSIATLAGEPVALPDSAAQQGSVDVSVPRSTIWVLTARGEGGQDHAAASVLAPDDPDALLFTAIPAQVVAGEAVTLVWNARSGGPVEITDSDGAQVYEGTQPQGTVTVHPASSTTYRIDAAGQTDAIEVTVTPGISGFEASAPAVEPGGSVTLSWKVGGASQVTLSASGRGLLMTSTDPLVISDGTFEDTLPAEISANTPVTYVLEARRDDFVLHRELTVWVGVEPVFENVLVPAYVKEDVRFSLAWETRHADRVQVIVDGTVIHQATTPELTRHGTVELPGIPAGGSVELLLRATNDRGGEALQRHVVSAVGIPTFVDFTASTGLIANGGDPVTLSWNVPNARWVRISQSDGRVVAELEGATAELASITVHPNALTTYVLHADNRVGDPLPTQPSVQVDVTTPATLLWNPGSVPLGASVELVGSTAAGSGDVLGLPGVVKNASGEAFIDISQSGTEIVFSPFWTDFPQLVSLAEPFDAAIFGVHGLEPDLSVNINGWFVFASTEEWGEPDNGPGWPNDDLAPLAMAPWFDDLDLKPDGTSKVYQRVDGQGLDRRLIVQWTRVTSTEFPGSTLTFQAQVYTSGKIVFAYQTVQDVAGNTPSIGVVNRHESDAVVPPDLPTSGDTYTFFGSRSVPVPVVASADPYFVRVQVGTGGYVEITDAPGILTPGQLEITEVNLNPKVAGGQWFEVRNNTPSDLDLGGWELDFGGATHTVSGSVPLPGNGRIVFAQSPLAGDGVPVAYTWGAGQSIAAGGNIGLRIAGGLYTSLSLPANVPAGYSWHLGSPSAAMTSSGIPGEEACLASSLVAYGSNGQRGTPGASDTPCPNYAAPAAITANFEPIALTGTPVPLVQFDPDYDPHDEGLGTIQLATPVVIDGLSLSQLVVGSNGFISFDPAQGCDPSDLCWWNNKITPSTTVKPRGFLAPFWDDLWANPGGGIYHQRKSGYTIVSWEDYARYGEPDTLSFQVKFFDTGKVEIHFGTMQGPDGSTSTTWWENRSGTAAYVINADSTTPGVASNTAWMFAYP